MIASNAVLVTNKALDLTSMGIDRIELSQADTYLQQSNPSVMGAHCQPATYQELIRLMLQEKRKNSSKRFLIFHENLTPAQLMEIHNLIHPAMNLPFSEDLNFSDFFASSFADYYKQEQDKQLVALVNETNEELKRLTITLEEKVHQRQLELEATRKKNMEAAQRFSILKKTLVQIYRASSINEIEHGVAKVLKNDFNVAWVKIRHLAQTSLSDKLEKLKFYKTQLKAAGQVFGHVFFYKDGGMSFDGKEKRFLNQVADAVSLSIDRAEQRSNSRELKKQWEATFDAISDPICLTDSEYNIMRINSGFRKKTANQADEKILGEKCYKILFERETPCEGCHRGQIYQLRNPAQRRNSEVFEVYSNNLGDQDKALYFQVYRDVTRELNLQRQVIETAKMAELGTISSSIAHELNNPIGGMLNFVQLMKMDLQGDEEYFADILEIEKGIIKCKDIVKNLLGFARKSFNTEITEVDLNEIIEQAIMITELKTRSIGIKINFEKPDHAVLMQGRFNLLTHALRNILQNSQEELIGKRAADKGFKGRIDIKVQDDKNHIKVFIDDNGEGLKPGIEDKIFDPLFTTKDPETNSGLGLTLALQIVKEHNGTIRVSSGKDKKLCFEVCFFKSEVQSGPSEF